MKNYVKALFVGALALTVGLGGVNAATASQKIDASACETVYTNYYFFLDANTDDFFNKSELSKIKHNTIAEYTNNSYQIRDFDPYNVGYGQVAVSRTTTTSRDGITSMSLSDFYDVALKASRISGGAYSEGSKNYIVAHDWYSVKSDGTAQKEPGSMSIANLSRSSLIDATVDATSTFTRESRISASAPNPFVIRINRSYYGYLTGKPVKNGSYNWYVHPALYYVQYCAKKTTTPTQPITPDPVKRTYTVTYYGNGSNVTNVPGRQEAYEGNCLYISNRPTRTGYRFLGWSVSSTSLRQVRAEGSRYCGEDGNLELYAIWEKEQTVIPDPVVQYYNVYYKANTSDTVTAMPSDSLNITNDRDVYIATNVPIRDGYSFVGWGLTSDSTTPYYRGGDLYQDRKDLTLYAIWKKNPDPVQPPVPDNPQTGIEDYFLPMGGIALVSGLGLKYMKKRIYQGL